MPALMHLDPNRCQATYWRGYQECQCERDPWKDGYCKPHHPETMAARYKKSEEKSATESDRLKLVSERERIEKEIVAIVMRLDMTDLAHWRDLRDARLRLESVCAKLNGKGDHT